MPPISGSRGRHHPMSPCSMQTRRFFRTGFGQLTRLEDRRPEIGAINSQVLRMDRPGLIDNAGDELSWYGAATKRGYGRAAVELQHEREVFSPCAAACLYRRSFLVETGGFDADFFAYLEDVDLGLRGRLLGYKYLYLPTAKVLHKGHGAALPHSRYVEMMTRNRLLLFAKNIPGKLLLRHAAQLLHGQLYFIIAYARPWSSLKGYLSFIVCLPGVFPKRRQIFRNTSLNPDQIEALLHNGAPCPSASGLLGVFCRKHMRAIFVVVQACRSCICSRHHLRSSRVPMRCFRMSLRCAPRSEAKSSICRLPARQYPASPGNCTACTRLQKSRGSRASARSIIFSFLSLTLFRSCACFAIRPSTR